MDLVSLLQSDIRKLIAENQKRKAETKKLKEELDNAKADLEIFSEFEPLLLKLDRFASGDVLPDDIRLELIQVPNNGGSRWYRDLYFNNATQTWNEKSANGARSGGRVRF